MIKPKRTAEQQIAHEAERRALDPLTSRQTISNDQAEPEFQENHKRLSGINAWDIAAVLERTVVAVRARAERVGVSLRQIRVAAPRRLAELGLKTKRK